MKTYSGGISHLGSHYLILCRFARFYQRHINLSFFCTHTYSYIERAEHIKNIIKDIKSCRLDQIVF